MARRVPKRRLGHKNWRQGFIQNSPHGNDLFAEQTCDWVDNDGHLSADRAWVNGHGWPEKTWGSKRFEVRTWEELSKLHHRYRGRVYSLRTAAQAFRDAHKREQSVEWEIKDIRPLNQIDGVVWEALQRLARHAEETWGPKWAQHLNLKMVSTMGGGFESYVLPIAQMAHELGIPVLITARGRDRFRRKWPACVTYVRNSLVPVR
jgi:hypothetical protein